MCFLFLTEKAHAKKDEESRQNCRQASAGPGEHEQADSLGIPMRLCRAVSGFLCE